MAIKHAKTAIPDVDKVDCTDWNANHTGTLNHQTEITNVGINTHVQIDTAIVTLTNHIADSSDPHGVTLTQTNITCAGNIAGGDTLTIVTGDHGVAATDEVVNVSYGTGDPPAANTTTEGSLFVKYTA